MHYFGLRPLICFLCTVLIFLTFYDKVYINGTPKKKGIFKKMERKASEKIHGYRFGKNCADCFGESAQHYHSHYEIFYIKNGSCRFFIDNRTIDAQSGDLIIIPSGAIHLVDSFDGSEGYFFIRFDDSFIPENIDRDILQSKYLYRLNDLAASIEEIFSKIEGEYNYPDEYTESMLSCYTGEILYNLIRHRGAPESTTTGNELIDDILSYIKQNYMSDIKLSAVAKMKSISQEHLSRTFKSCTGLGFNEYLTLLRLRKAEEMIRTEPGKTISEIAYECGFNDGNYFSYKFKKTYGVSPIKLRN